MNDQPWRRLVAAILTLGVEIALALVMALPLVLLIDATLRLLTGR